MFNELNTPENSGPDACQMRLQQSHAPRHGQHVRHARSAGTAGVSTRSSVSKTLGSARVIFDADRAGLALGMTQLPQQALECSLWRRPLAPRRSPPNPTKDRGTANRRSSNGTGGAAAARRCAWSKCQAARPHCAAVARVPVRLGCRRRRLGSQRAVRPPAWRRFPCRVEGEETDCRAPLRESPPPRCRGPRPRPG